MPHKVEFFSLKNNEEVALVLLERMNLQRDLVDHQNRELKTALHYAAQHGMVSVVQQLLSKGANIYLTDNIGKIPALSCIPDSRVAECLFILLHQMSQRPAFLSFFSKPFIGHDSPTHCPSDVSRSLFKVLIQNFIRNYPNILHLLE